MAPIACDLTAISLADRPRYNQLMQRLRAAIRRRDERADGYVFELDGAVLCLAEVTEWVSMERLCCPFLFFQISDSGDSLQLTGPPGVKPIIAAAFAAGH